MFYNEFIHLEINKEKLNSLTNASCWHVKQWLWILWFVKSTHFLSYTAHTFHPFHVFFEEREWERKAICVNKKAKLTNNTTINRGTDDTRWESRNHFNHKNGIEGKRERDVGRK